MKGNLRYWEISTGGRYGSQILDAVSGTVSATGLQCTVIDVRRAAIFTVLSGYGVDRLAADFRVDNNLTGYTIAAGLIFAPYGGYFTDISISTGQVAYYTKRND